MVRQATLTQLAALLVIPVVLPVIPGGSEASAEERRLAVVVGANSGAGWRVQLRHAERDARKMAAVLTELGGIAPEDLTLLVDDPTATDVIAALDRVQQRAEAAGGEVAVVFYYSGHASRKALELSGTRLPVRALRRRFERWKSGVRLAFLDACHSGVAIRTKGGKRTRRRVTFGVDGGATEGYAILTSSAADEESQESDVIRGSFFTHHLVSGMRGAADRDGDRRVTLGEAYRYAYSRTLRETAGGAKVAQHPNFDVALKGGNDVVLTELREDAARLQVPAGEDRAQWILYQPDRGLVLAEVSENAQTATTLNVPPGEIEVYRRTSASVQRGSIVVKPGSQVRLSQAILEPVPLTAYLRKGEAGVSVALQVGLSGFVDDRMATEFAGTAPLLSLSFTKRDLGIFGLDLGLDVGFIAVDQEVVLDQQPHRQTLTEVQVGASLKYRMDFGSLSLAAGPRVAYLYLGRSLPDGTDDGVHTIAAGAVVGFHWRFSQRISIGLDGKGAWVPIPESDVSPDRDQLMVELQAVAAFHF